ncbi:hypothetical protein QUF61_17075 [Candidatus Venteria ishoeyi]|uniref:hypothetical protein n=1 Tax=Candidatus Venteria ishoeyi TaxID=1899563 RepID=UPI0025A4EA03|nr:hypothetical protein [Candidatus Venteria ishoeyi]MDM8548205.1 hypothetical protein [Candidatus Venteria ishoeyi]
MLERGRDNWKTKYCEAKLQIKYLKNKLRRIEQSQQNWKQKAQASAVEVKYLQAAIEQHKQREEGDKKNRVASPKSNANRKSSKSYVLNRSCVVVSQPRFDWRKWFAHSVKKLNS